MLAEHIERKLEEALRCGYDPDIGDIFHVSLDGPEPYLRNKPLPRKDLKHLRWKWEHEFMIEQRKSKQGVWALKLETVLELVELPKVHPLVKRGLVREAERRGLSLEKFLADIANSFGKPKRLSSEKYVRSACKDKK